MKDDQDSALICLERSRLSAAAGAAQRKYQAPTLVKHAMLSAITSEDGKGVSGITQDT